MEHYVNIIMLIFTLSSFVISETDIDNHLSPFYSVLPVNNINVDSTGPILSNIKALANHVCNEELIIDASEKGEIKGPDYDTGTYGKDLSCSYKIRAPYGHRIKITFKGIDIKPSNLCKKDRLILKGQNGDEVLGVFCGNSLPYPVLSREGQNEIEMLFQTKTSDGRGFHIQFEASPVMELCEKKETCRNRNCYKRKRKCDGRDDCGDGTDEENCGVSVEKPSNENCGNTPIKPNNLYVDSNKLVAAIPNSWPWHVSLQHADIEPNGHFCAGTLISSQWVISAAHCFTGIRHPSDVRVVLGSHYKFNKTEYEVTRVADRIISYPDLEGRELKNADMKHDISLIKLNAPVKINVGVQPACLWWWSVSPGWKCFSTGWGESTHSPDYSKQLKQSIQFIKNSIECPHDEDIHVCVEKPQDDPCLGDSGGPLVCYLSDHWYLIGPASHNAAGYRFKMGRLCQSNEGKFIFTNIVNKRDWIEGIIKENS